MSSLNYSFSNPILKDQITILQDTENKLVFKTYLEPNGGQTELHYHTKISERFEVVQGELAVFLDKDKKIFKAGDSQLIEPYTPHRFYNNSLEQVIFDVEIINPKKIKFALQIMYGLAKAGRTNSIGLPKNVFHLAIGLNMMNAYSPDYPRNLQYIAIKVLAGLEKIIGIEKKILDKYCEMNN